MPNPERPDPPPSGGAADSITTQPAATENARDIGPNGLHHGTPAPSAAGTHGSGANLFFYKLLLHVGIPLACGVVAFVVGFGLRVLGGPVIGLAAGGITFIAVYMAVLPVRTFLNNSIGKFIAEAEERQKQSGTPDHAAADAGAPTLMELALSYGLSAVIFVGALLVLTGILWLFDYKLQSAAAIAALCAALLVMVTRFLMPSPTTRAKAETTAHTDSVREVIETVVFVVVLVLLLKSFVAEAFVIPTGSMAETLFGYQKGITCPKCGFAFPVNVSQEVDPTEGSPMRITGCTCPNCRYPIDFAVESHSNSKWVDPGWSSGDRVLVGKYFYELVDHPERLEVVVFKYPGGNEPPWPKSGPEKNYVPLNYIKRLIGKPGETIAIYQGKLYVLSPELSPRYDDWEKAQHDPELMARLWQTKYQHVDEARTLFTEGKFAMVRKPPDTMLAMSRIVYDNDHPASDLKGQANYIRWEGAGWTPDEANGFASAGSGTGIDWLRYGHRLRGKDSKKTLITDYTGYNTYETPGHSGHSGENWVGDLLLECEVTLDKAEGQFLLELSKSHDRFQAVWNLATGDCDLYRVHDGKKEDKPLASAKTAVSRQGRSYRLRFANVDGKLTVWVDGALPFGEDGVLYPTNLNLNTGPTAANDLEPASLGVQGAAVKVRKIKLLRDTYYTNDPTKPDYPGMDFGNPERWDVMDKLDKDHVKTIYVQPGHYLCLGDNSPESSDGRSWGCVPERLLLGRAMLVYYPFSRAGKIR
jgi:signal peptidase I